MTAKGKTEIIPGRPIKKDSAIDTLQTNCRSVLPKTTKTHPSIPILIPNSHALNSTGITDKASAFGPNAGYSKTAKMKYKPNDARTMSVRFWKGAFR